MRDTLTAFYEGRKDALDTLDVSHIDTSLVYDRAFGFQRCELMCIGEAPGENEAREGRPFCGAAGKNLATLLQKTDIKRENILLSNAFAFRTTDVGMRGTKNRTPSKVELRLGASMLEKELSIVTPRIIIALGGSAQKALAFLPEPSLVQFLKEAPLHTLIPLTCSFGSVLVAKAYHPSPLVFNRRDKRELLELFFESLRTIS